MMVLHTTYFGPVQWYQQLYRSECVYIDGNERWQKQTIRNRCYIAGVNGIQALTVPIIHHPSPVSPPQGGVGGGFLTRNIRISNHGKWRREHWNALQSAYGESAFFDYYADDIRPFFTEEWEYLFDFNMAIIHKMCELLEIKAPSNLPPEGEASITHHPSPNTHHPTPITQHPTPITSSSPQQGRLGGVSYYQVYQQKHGFLPNLSILDLLFNMGNEAILYL